MTDVVAAPDVVVNLLAGLLKLTADPGAGKRFTELATIRAKVIAAEALLEVDRAALAGHEERVRSDLALAEADLKESREKAEGEEGALVGRQEHQAEVERLWAGIVLPSELPERPLRPAWMTEGADDARD